MENEPGRFSACHYATSVPQLKETLRQTPEPSDVRRVLELDEALDVDAKLAEPVR